MEAVCRTHMSSAKPLLWEALTGRSPGGWDGCRWHLRGRVGRSWFSDTVNHVIHECAHWTDVHWWAVGVSQCSGCRNNVNEPLPRNGGHRWEGNLSIWLKNTSTNAYVEYLGTQRSLGNGKCSKGEVCKTSGRNTWKVLRFWCGLARLYEVETRGQSELKGCNTVGNMGSPETKGEIFWPKNVVKYFHYLSRWLCRQRLKNSQCFNVR